MLSMKPAHYRLSGANPYGTPKPRDVQPPGHSLAVHDRPMQQRWAQQFRNRYELAGCTGTRACT
jgi:hypothetical protein